MTLPRLILAFAALALVSGTIRSAAAEEEPLVALARSSRLAERREWLRLLHFGRTLSGRFQSEVDGKSFFLAPGGKRDPEAELVATLRAFVTPAMGGLADNHPLCRFPARREWLERELHVSFPAVPCPALARTLEARPLTGVSFVYAANFLSNPASAFGHAFLHLRVALPEGTPQALRDREDFGAEFIAIPTTHNPVAYAFMGMTGLFQGKVEVVPFEKKRQLYSEKQGRDLWEYDLALTPEELRRLNLHVWELEQTELDYYYIERNCAYEVLRILEAAAPRLELLDGLKVLVFPLDTLTAVTSVPGLVKTVSYRPSKSRAQHARPGEGPPLSELPSLGHGPMRVTFGTGMTSQYRDGFATFGYRLALHDLSDPQPGWAPLSEVELLDLHLRFDLERAALTVDRLTFLDVMALHPLADEPRLSWRIKAFGERLHDGACQDCFAHGLDGSLGGTVATRGRALAVFVMADAYAAFLPDSSGFGQSFVRLGAGPFAGVRVQGGGTTLLLTGSWSYLPWEKIEGTFDARLTVKSALSRNVALGVEAAAQPSSAEAVLASYVYF